MFEEYHYKGFFNFMFHPTNQTKIVKGYLKKIFPEGAIKSSKKVSKELDGMDFIKFLKDHKNNLVYPLQFYKTELLIDHLEHLFKEDPRSVAIFYILVADVMNTVRFKRDFNIADDLAQNILIAAFTNSVGNKIEDEEENS